MKRDEMKILLKQYWVIFLILIIVVPIIIYMISVVPVFPVGGNNDWAGFWGGYLGAIIGGLCTVVGVFLSIRYAQKNYREDLEYRVLPYIALTTLHVKRNVDIFNLKSKEQINDTEDQESYLEYVINKYYFVIIDKCIKVTPKLTDKQELLLQNAGYCEEEDNGNKSISRKSSVLSIPINLENVGNGAAVGFRIGVHNSGIKWNEGEYTLPKHLKVGDFFSINIFFEDVRKCELGEKFYLRICYENIYKQEYMQEYGLNVDEDYVVTLDLMPKQVKKNE